MPILCTGRQYPNAPPTAQGGVVGRRWGHVITVGGMSPYNYWPGWDDYGYHLTWDYVGEYPYGEVGWIYEDDEWYAEIYMFFSTPAGPDFGWGINVDIENSVGYAEWESFYQPSLPNTGIEVQFKQQNPADWFMAFPKPVLIRPVRYDELPPDFCSPRR